MLLGGRTFAGLLSVSFNAVETLRQRGFCIENEACARLRFMSGLEGFVFPSMPSIDVVREGVGGIRLRDT